MHIQRVYQLLSGASILRQSTATTVFVSSYAGTVTSLALTSSNGNYSLSQLGVSTGCAPNPSWLTLDYSQNTLYCLNEGLETVNGSLSSFTINPDGTLMHIQNTTAPSGPVAGVIYGQQSGHKGIALAHYSGHSVTAWTLETGGNFSLDQTIGPFTLNKTGPVASRQNAPYEHEAITDPTGQYILVPDLGADLVRVFSYDETTLQLTPLAPLVAAPGSGPRHAAFYTPAGISCATCSTYLYIANELGATVTGYAVTYRPNNTGLSFQVVFNSSTYGPLTPPASLAPSEIHVSPDNRFLVIGNRNASTFTVPNADPNNATTPILSDTISTFKLDPSGVPTFTQLAPAYGSFPRQFSLNRYGNLVGVGLQYSSQVVILGRDVETGLIGAPVASFAIEGQITSVVFNDGSGPWN